MAVFTVMALSWLFTTPAGAQTEAPSVLDCGPDEVRTESPDSLTISLLTCYPGREIYSLCGHSAVRVKGNGIDSVWNYGVFNFREPNFVYRFVKGETDYMGVAYPFEWFMPEYLHDGRKVVEQKLNLSQAESQRLLKELRRSVQPDRRLYRYNYVKNNCATRIYEMIDTAAGINVIYPDTVRYGSFRNEMKSYHAAYPWYQFGIDLCLGSGIDYPTSAREEMFVPIEMMKAFASARIDDGRPLVASTEILFEGTDYATEPPTVWWLTPLFWSWVLFALALLICIHDLKKRKITRIAYSVWFGILGIAGLLIAFLVFISSHEATSPNVLLLWLNPLQLVIGLGIWFRKARPAVTAMAVVDTLVILLLLIVWSFLSQHANMAFFPLMGATLAMSASYMVINSTFSRES